MEQEALYFDKNDIIKNAFHKNKTPTSINEVDIKGIVLSNKKPYGKINIHLNTLLVIYMKVMLFHYHYV